MKIAMNCRLIRPRQRGRLRGPDVPGRVPPDAVSTPAAGWVVRPPAAELAAAATTTGPEPRLRCSWTKTNHPYCLPQQLSDCGGFAGLPALRELSLRGAIAVIQLAFLGSVE